MSLLVSENLLPLSAQQCLRPRSQCVLCRSTLGWGAARKGRIFLPTHIYCPSSCLVDIVSRVCPLVCGAHLSIQSSHPIWCWVYCTVDLHPGSVSSLFSRKRKILIITMIALLAGSSGSHSEHLATLASGCIDI